MATGVARHEGGGGGGKIKLKLSEVDNNLFCPLDTTF